MSVKLLTEHRLEFESLKGGCTGSSESTLVKMHCVAAQFMIYWLRADALHSYLEEKENSGKYHKSSFSCMQCAVSCSSSLIFFYFMQTHKKTNFRFRTPEPPRATRVLKQQQHVV